MRFRSRRPDRAARLVAPKGKLASAAPHGRALAATPAGADDEAAMIALAALGDPAQEGRFTRAFTAAHHAHCKTRLRSARRLAAKYRNSFRSLFSPYSLRSV